MSRQHRLTTLAVISVLWFAAVAGSAYSRLAPVWVKKNVTIAIKNTGQVRVVFSAAEPDNEVVYAMKTQWIPLLETSPSQFVGQVIDTPYQDFRQRALLRTLPGHLALGLMPVLIGFGLRKHLHSYK